MIAHDQHASTPCDWCSAPLARNEHGICDHCRDQMRPTATRFDEEES